MLWVGVGTGVDTVKLVATVGVVAFGAGVVVATTAADTAVTTKLTAAEELAEDAVAGTTRVPSPATGMLPIMTLTLMKLSPRGVQKRWPLTMS